MAQGFWGKVIRNQKSGINNQDSIVTMRPNHSTSILRTAPSLIGPKVKLGLKDKLAVRNTHGVIDQTPMAKDLSVNEFDFMTYAGLGKGVWGDTSEKVDLFIQGLRS